VFSTLANYSQMRFRLNFCPLYVTVRPRHILVFTYIYIHITIFYFLHIIVSRSLATRQLFLFVVLAFSFSLFFLLPLIVAVFRCLFVVVAFFHHCAHFIFCLCASSPLLSLLCQLRCFSLLSSRCSRHFFLVILVTYFRLYFLVAFFVCCCSRC